nr:MAG TPA: hypothetical protein [Caudoviricetes sp.]
MVYHKRYPMTCYLVYCGLINTCIIYVWLERNRNLLF